MGKSSAASASRRSSSPRGSTATDMETSSPSLLSRAGESGEEAYGQTLIKNLQHPARSAHKQKTLGQRPQGPKPLSTDLPLALFSVVAISRARQSDPKSIHVFRIYHCPVWNATAIRNDQAPDVAQ